ncbi:2-hydroxy-3-oxopropionate reductase-like [Pollicipes pollicipes]|uniref:2-hydroxy-3-oxopropionate reductase-like n=1 Tax=Pollicipes pollicipes TaxID=41117 RepID=UPI001884A817|nr:2-hydroxy-3-oxopropionate reductase-like [Pollicipes pollicipes]
MALVRACRALSVPTLARRALTVAPRRQLTSVSAETPIGVVGVGNVGDAVCKNLLRSGYKVAAMYDIDPRRGADLDDRIPRATCSRQVAEQSDVVITCLPKPAHVEASYSGADGLLAGLRPGAVWIDHSTTDYQQTIRYHQQVKEKEVDMVEAPITGGLSALQTGTMVTYLGGDKAVIDLVSPILSASYTNLIYMGPVGSALITKVMSNMLCMVNAIGMAEAMMIAKRSGLDLHQFWHAIRAGCGSSFAWETAGPSLMRGDYDPTFTIDLHCKDLDLGYQIAKTHRVPIPVHALVQQISNEAMYKYGPEAACYSGQKLYEDSCGEQLRCDGFEDWSFENRIIDGSVVPQHKNIDPPKQ